MKKEDFIKIGVDSMLAEKCAAASAEELRGFVTRTRFNEISDRYRLLEQKISENGDAAEKLQKYLERIEKLKAEISDLKRENAEMSEAHAAEIHRFKVNAAVDRALANAGAKNLTAVKALIKGLDNAKLDRNGNVVGLDEQITELKISDDYLFFSEKSSGFTIRGAIPGESGDDVPPADLSKLTYTQLAAYLEKNPNAKLF